MVDVRSIDNRKRVEGRAVGKLKNGARLSFEKELKGAGLLEDAFTAFNDAAEGLKEYYSRLERRVGELNGELAEKNIALEESLKRSSDMERYQANILRSLPSAVMVADDGGRITIFNRRAEEISGFHRSEAEGKKIGDIFGDQVFSVIDRRGPLESELEYFNRSGERLFLKVFLTPLVDENGDRDGSVIIFHDITRERMLEESLERGKRLATMGEMAAKLAHEIRNPLGGIELFASNLKKSMIDNPRARKMAENICSGVATLNHLVANVLQFARVDKPALSEVSVRAAVEDALILSLHLVERSGIEVIKDFPPLQVAVMGNGEMMKQAFLNIILNAVQAMEDGGRLKISMETQDGGRIRVVFDDDGKGIPAAVRERVFDPFYSTKERGSGLGLAIVHNIVEAHNGSLSIESEEGRGTRVTVSLPANITPP